MLQPVDLRGTIRKMTPSSLREARFRFMRLGLGGYARYRRLERVERQKPRPRAGQAYDLGGGTILLHATTVPSVVSHWVEYGHGIEELHAFKRLAPEHHTLLDIGAAEGIYSAAFCSLTGQHAWAFEPSPEMFHRLNHLCGLNPHFAIVATNIALGKGNGQLPVRQYPDGQFSGVGAVSDQSTVMTLTTLDAFVASRGLKPDFAKIDVEGMELDVLIGGEQTFRNSVKTIVLEVHYDLLEQLGHSMLALQGILESYGYRFEALDGRLVENVESYARAQPELLPGYTVIVCRR